jgi:uncharacterized ion transporter superfamily protein YfcC
VARAVSVVLEQGLILDTITEILFSAVASHSRGSYRGDDADSQSALNFPMPSQAGQAMLALTNSGSTRRPASCFETSGSAGLSVRYLTSCVITPTYGALLAMLAVAQVSFRKWLRFMIPIYLILFRISELAIVMAIHMGIK